MSQEVAHVPTPEDARSALDTVGEMQAVGLRRGLYPRRVAAAIALWAAALAVTVGTAWGIPVFTAGVLGLFWARNRQGAWVSEVESPRQFWLIILPLGLLAGGLMLVAAALREAGYLPLSFTVAAALAGFLFLLSQRSHAVRRRHVGTQA